jgi:hypothetical protein
MDLDKLINLKGNKYLLTRATNLAIDRLGNIKGYPEDTRGWKVVPCVLSMVLNDKIKFHRVPLAEAPALTETPEEEK